MNILLTSVSCSATDVQLAFLRVAHRSVELLPLLDEFLRLDNPLGGDLGGLLAALPALGDLAVRLLMLRHLRHRLRHVVQVAQPSRDVLIELLSRTNGKSASDYE